MVPVWPMHRELDQMEQRMDFQVPSKGLEMVISALMRKQHCGISKGRLEQAWAGWELEQIEPRLNFQVPTAGLELVILSNR